MVKYTVDGTKVTAEITDMKNDLTNRLMNRMGIGYVPTKMLEAAMMPKRVVGVAYCHPEDAFNIEVGKCIAHQRVVDKYNKEYDRAYSRVMECFNHMLTSSGYFYVECVDTEE